ncbi:MAG TPA: L-histidine N(alpha)-methyltransferase [Terriglobales bacterium]|nr:L-histidine N(alpha)-methyltransferase [Terriglobales bacterium]
MIARELAALPAYTEEVALGLTSRPKSLPCKLFYDGPGSALFEEITRLPEYYLTRTELEILHDRADEMVRTMGTVTVVELGAGTAVKTCTLLESLSRQRIGVRYFPVDISRAALAQARERVDSLSRQILVRPVVADFSDGFEFLRDIPGKKLVAYLGSSIGNFDPETAIGMLSQIHQQLAPQDTLLLGTDLVKDESMVLAAYDDSQGVTEQFNKNILARLNRELLANFDLDSFRHVALWNPQKSCVEIHLESLSAQTVDLPLLHLRVYLSPGERIHTENSYKYTVATVKRMLERSGYGLTHTWLDRRHWFALHLARVQPPRFQS